MSTPSILIIDDEDQLRKKIEKDPNRPEHIITESGIGYRFIGERQ